MKPRTSDPKNWRLADVEAAKVILAKAIPGIRFSETDYGFSLSAKPPSVNNAWWIFHAARPEREEDPDESFRADLAKTIADMKQWTERAKESTK